MIDHWLLQYEIRDMEITAQNSPALQSKPLMACTGLNKALMELMTNKAHVYKYFYNGSGVSIQIAPTPAYSDGQMLHGCKLVYKKENSREV